MVKCETVHGLNTMLSGGPFSTLMAFNSISCGVVGNKKSVIGNEGSGVDLIQLIQPLDLSYFLFSNRPLVTAFTV